MPKVFVPNKGGHPFDKAERYGELVYITEGWLPDRYGVNSMWRLAQNALQDSSSEDYIILTGLTTICVVCCCMFVAMHGRLNLLLHHERDEYKERTLVFGEKDIRM